MRPAPKTEAQLNQVVSAIHLPYVTDIVVATDAGREGELIARAILIYAKVAKNCWRFWTSQALSPSIIREELKPFFEANGCRSYNIFREVARENNKDIVAPDQLVSEVLFDDVSAMAKFHVLFEQEPLKSLAKRYRSWQIPGTNRHYISVV